MSVSEQLPTYHSPNSTLTVIELGEGWVHSCSDTGIDLTIQLSIRTTQSFPQICVVVQNELLHFFLNFFNNKTSATTLTWNEQHNLFSVFSSQL